jgi:hypothetical protein
MPISATIDDMPCLLERLPDGSIRVTHESRQINPCHGPATDGDVTYIVHPAQRNQFEHLNRLLAPDERGKPLVDSDPRPWWSYAGAAKEKQRGKDDGE